MKRGTGLVSFLVIVLGMVTMSGQGCQGSKSIVGMGTESSNGGLNFGPGQGQPAFQATVYNWVRTQNCTICHGATTPPLFAQADPVAAYAAAKTVVDFNNVDSSTFIDHAGNNHCGMSICASPANSATMKSLLEQWASVENAVPVGPGGPSGPGAAFLTASVNLPATIPSLTQNPAPVRFQLSGLQPAVPALSKAIAEVEIQFSNATTYRVNRIKIVGATAPVNLTGVHVYLKAPSVAGPGFEEAVQAAAWAALQVTLPVSTVPSPLPTGVMTTVTPLSTNAILLDAVNAGGAAQTVMTLGFDNLQ
jgi:hypothetical protein